MNETPEHISVAIAALKENASFDPNLSERDKKITLWWLEIVEAGPDGLKQFLAGYDSTYFWTGMITGLSIATLIFIVFY